ncbi:hypothetical protein SRABI128_05900 [Microbacterium sp. Bi128]|nr:hypothetical protein SRABI128_05900 [Microbacterium sp. Bi128]
MTLPVGAVTALVVLARMSVPVVPDGVILPARSRSGVGSAAPVDPLPLSWTRKYACALMVPLSAPTPLDAPVPVAERYCNDQLDRSTSTPPGLYSSTNFFAYGAFALPPLR